MGISFEINAEEGVIYSIAEGTIGLEDSLAHRKNLLADPKFHPDLVEIVEFRLSGFRFSPEEVKALTFSTVPSERPRKLAVVADGPKRKLALRFKEWVKAKVLVEVFTDFGSAKKWTTSD